MSKSEPFFKMIRAGRDALVAIRGGHVNFERRQ